MSVSVYRKFAAEQWNFALTRQGLMLSTVRSKFKQLCISVTNKEKPKSCVFPYKVQCVFSVLLKIVEFQNL